MRKVMTALAVAASISVLSACGGGSHNDSVSRSDNKSETLAGQWHQINTKDTGFYMVASVYDEGIQINWNHRDGKSLYWLGSFDGSVSMTDNYTVISQADSDANDAALLASLDHTKVFTYHDGMITYDVTSMGNSYKVELVKDEAVMPTVTVTTPEGVEYDEDYYSKPKPKKSATVKVSTPKRKK